MFICTRKAGPTTVGRPYKVRFLDLYGNVHVHHVEKPDIINQYVDHCNRIDICNQVYQGNLVLGGGNGYTQSVLLHLDKHA